MPDSLSKIDSLSTKELFKTALSANMTVIAGAAIVGVFFYQQAGETLTFWIISMTLLAERVELSSRELFLGAHDCEYAQGFYYSKPLPGVEIEKLYRDKAGIGAIISS